MPAGLRRLVGPFRPGAPSGGPLADEDELTGGTALLGSQGFVHEAAAVQEAIAQGLLEHPEMPLDETLAMARVFEKIRAQIGLTYPWDEEGEGAAKKARR